METMKEFLEEINEPSRTELETVIAKLKNEVLELHNLVDALEYNLEMAKQALNDNEHSYFSLRGRYLEHFSGEGSRRNRIAGDYIFQSINEIKAVLDKLNNKEGES